MIIKSILSAVKVYALPLSLTKNTFQGNLKIAVASYLKCLSVYLGLNIVNVCIASKKLLYKTVLLYNITTFQYNNMHISGTNMCSNIYLDIWMNQICHSWCYSWRVSVKFAVIGSAQKEDVRLSHSRACERGRMAHSKLNCPVLPSTHTLPQTFQVPWMFSTVTFPWDTVKKNPIQQLITFNTIPHISI